MKTQYFIVSAALSLACLAPQSQAGIGEDTAAAITQYYNDTRAYCETPSSPAFMCSGVLLRATTPGLGYYSWNPSPRSEQSGGVSFSYLRTDANFVRLAFASDNGFTLYPYNFAPADTIKPSVLCSFPIDGWTDHRDNAGCGDSSVTKSTYVNGLIQYDRQERACQDYQKKIITAEAWSQHFWWPAPEVDPANRLSSQCGFDVRETRSDRASAFYTSLRAVRYSSRPHDMNAKPTVTLPAYMANELRLATWSNTDKLPVQSFFYIKDRLPGLDDARKDQTDWYTETGKFIPIIAITLPTSLKPQAAFTYSESDQIVTSDANNQTAP